jgi:hypothetical protein
MSEVKKQRILGMVVMEAERGKIYRKATLVFHGIVPEKLEKPHVPGKGRENERNKYTRKTVEVKGYNGIRTK